MKQIVKQRLHDATGCPTGWKSVYTRQPVCQPVGQRVGQQVASLYTRYPGTIGTIGWKYVYTTQPVGQHVVQLVVQQVVSTAMNKLNLQIMHRFQWGKGHVKKAMFNCLFKVIKIS